MAWRMPTRCGLVWLLTAWLGLVVPSGARAQDVALSFDQGLVSLSAHGVPLGEVLDRWAQVGHTTIINGNQLQALTVTLDLVKVPESEALGILLRALPGYLLAGRSATRPNESAFDRIVLLASRPTPPASAPAATVLAPPAPASEPTAPSARVLLPEPDEVNRDGLVIIGGRNPSVGASPATPPTTGASPTGSASFPGASSKASTTITGRPGEVAPVTQQQPGRPQLQRTRGGEAPPPGGIQTAPQ